MRQYLSTLHKQIDNYFNFNEVKTLCFDLGIDYENIPGDVRSAFIRNLIVSLAKQNRLQELVDKVRVERPFIDWQDIPANFELPASVAQEDMRQVIQYNVYGDMVQGNKVGGDKITVGNISGSSGVAIGRGASANVTTYQDKSAPDLAPLFAPLQTIVARQNPAFSSKVNQLKAQVELGSAAHDSQVAGLVADIAEGAPAAQPALTALFHNPLAAAAAGPTTRFVLSRLG